MKSGHSDDKNSSKGNARPRNIKAETASPACRAQSKQLKQPKKITETYLHNSGLYYLQRFAASTSHFRTVMLRKIDRSCRSHAEQNRDECLSMLERLIEKFVAAGLLNDDAFSRGVVASLKRRGLSERAIHSRLQSKGLSRQEIETALSAFHVDNASSPVQTEYESALKFARKKKLGPYAGNNETSPQKAMAAFARAGFSFELARKVLNLPADAFDESSEA